LVVTVSLLADGVCGSRGGVWGKGVSLLVRVGSGEGATRRFSFYFTVKFDFDTSKHVHSIIPARAANAVLYVITKV